MSLSDLGSTSIKEGVGARDKRRREDNFLCKDLAILRIGLFSDRLSLDMMMIVKEQDWTVGRANFVPFKRVLTLLLLVSNPSPTDGAYRERPWLGDHLLLLPCGLPS
jgi:hypothetical protein